MAEDIPSNILDELLSRFLINLDQEVLDDIILFMIQVELAYWFYIDFYLDEYSELPHVSMEAFVTVLNKNHQFLFKNATKDKPIKEVYSEWNRYKLSCHIVGAIILNESYNKCLLVQTYNLPRTWEFPKGKLAPSEKYADGAVREVKEETGFDIGPYLDESSYIEQYIFNRYNRLYIITGITHPESIKFEPQTRKEIHNISWFRIEDLPRYKKDPRPSKNLKMNSYLLFKIVPFIKDLINWIDKLKNGRIARPMSTLNEHYSHLHNTSNFSSLHHTQQLVDDNARPQSVPLTENVNPYLPHSYPQTNQFVNSAAIQLQPTVFSYQHGRPDSVRHITVQDNSSNKHAGINSYRYPQKYNTKYGPNPFTTSKHYSPRTPTKKVNNNNNNNNEAEGIFSHIKFGSEALTNFKFNIDDIISNI